MSRRNVAVPFGIEIYDGAVSTEYRRVTVRQTDRRTYGHLATA